MFRMAILCLTVSGAFLPDLGGASATDLAPPETVFFSTAANVPKFYTDFLQYHNASLANPIIAGTVPGPTAGALLKVGPAAPSCPLALEATELLYTVVETELFCAVLAGPEGGLNFLGGGISPDPNASLDKVKAALNARVPGTWQSTKIGSVPVEFLEIPGLGRFYICSTGSWILLGTSLPGLEHALQAVDSPGRGLSSTTLWKTNTAAQPSDYALLYFSRLDALAKISADAGQAALATLLSQRLGGLRAYSWTFSTGGPGSVGKDVFSYTLDESTTKSLGAMVTPLDPKWRKKVTPNASGFLVFNVDLSQLAATPAFAGLRFADAAGKFAPLQAGWTATWDAGASRSFSTWFLEFPHALENPALKPFLADGTKAKPDMVFPLGSTKYGFAAKDDLVWWGQTDAIRHFLGQEPDPSPGLLQITDALPSAENAFLDFRLDRQATARHAARELAANYTQWAEALRKKGIPLPETAPSIDLQNDLGPLRTTIGLTDSNIVVMNGFQLGKKTGSTLFTATSEILQTAYPGHIAAFTNAARFVFSSSPKEEAGKLSQAAITLLTADSPKPLPCDDPNLFDIYLWSNFLCGPLFAPNQNSVFSDIVCQFILADPPTP